MPRKPMAAAAAAPAATSSDDPQVAALEDVNNSLDGLLARASDLLQPTAAHKEAVLSACRLLHSVTRSLLEEEGGFAEAEELVTDGCDAEQIWGQMEALEGQGRVGLAKRVKTLAGRSAALSLAPQEKGKRSKINFDDAAGWGGEAFGDGGEDEWGSEEEEEEESGGEDEMDEDEDEDEDDDEEEGAGKSKKGKGAKKGDQFAVSKGKKGKKQSPEEFFDDMEKFVKNMERDEGGDDDDEDEDEEDEEGQFSSSKRSRKPKGELEEDMADEVQFHVSGAGEDDLNGTYTRNPKVCPFAVAYTNGDQVLLFERAGVKLSKGSVARSRWLLFCDADGVHGSNPYYQSHGTFANGLTGWKCVQGSAPAPTVSWAPEGDDAPMSGDEDEDDDEDGEGMEGESDEGSDEEEEG
ncbi:hypothetical protein T484DRAFT_1901016, partial [Baffinella frigidus]